MGTPQAPASIDPADLARQTAALELRLHPVIAELSEHICADCDDVCCKPEHCAETVESPWHRLVCSFLDVDLPPADTPPEQISFLSPAGCRLPAGRPVQCTAFVCRRIDGGIEDPLIRFVYHVLSGLPGHIMRDTTRYHHLMEIEDLEDLTAAQRRRLQSRIREAEYSLDVCLRILQTPVGQRDNASTTDVLKLAAIFPFAARSTAHESSSTTPS